MSRKGRLTIRDIGAELTVGALFFIALGILAFFTIILSKEALFSKRWELQVYFPRVAGLSQGDNVMARGVKVGHIKNIELTDSRVLVTANLGKKFSIYEDYEIKVQHSSILGGKYLSIDQGAASGSQVAIDTPLEGNLPTDMLQDTAELVQEIKTEVKRVSKSFHESKVLPKLADAVDNLQSLTADLRAGRGTFGKLLQDEAIYDTALEAFAELKNGAGSLDRAADSVNGAVADARAGNGTLGKLLTEDKVYNDLETLMANLRETSASLNNEGSTVGRLFHDQGKLYDRLLTAAENTEDISGRIRRGDGTVGKLVKDEDLYNDLRSTIQQLHAAIRDFREQAPISTFGSFVFGAL
ncbi:MAG: MlaD family protein [Lentisphaeria bacterium]